MSKTYLKKMFYLFNPFSFPLLELFKYMSILETQESHLILFVSNFFIKSEDKSCEFYLHYGSQIHVLPASLSSQDYHNRSLRVTSQYTDWSLSFLSCSSNNAFSVLQQEDLSLNINHTLSFPI